MNKELTAIGLVVLALGLGSIGLVAAQTTDYPASVGPFEEISVSIDESDGTSTTVDIFVNDSSGNVVNSTSYSTTGGSGPTEEFTFDVEPGDYDVSVEAGDDSQINSQTISVQEDNLIEERDLVVSEQGNETLVADATVSGSSDVEIQTVVLFNGQIVSTEANSYDSSGNTEILSAQYDPPQNGTYTVYQEVVNGSSSVVDSVYFDTLDESSGVVAGTGEGFLSGMSSIELFGTLAVVAILGMVLLGGRD